jgi:hypothetical protein
MDLKETVYEHVDRIHLPHDTNQSWAVVNSEMNLSIPSDADSLLSG